MTEQNTSSVDRLSALPDDVICHILSFLPTKISVSTSILARRWRFLWAHVPNIEFVQDDETKLRVGENFFDTINMVMSLYEAQRVNTFRLSFTNYCNPNAVDKFNTCIETAILRNVENLHLSLANYVYFPSCILTCKTVVDMRLRCFNYSLDWVVCLPSLKKLHLEIVRFDKADEEFPCLLSGCPVLEDLIIDRLVPHNEIMSSCYISSPTIKRLIVNYKIHFRSDHPCVRFLSLKIDTPALKYLQLLDCLSEVVCCGALISLIEAHVNLDDDVLYASSGIGFFVRLCNVKYLKFKNGVHDKVPESAFHALSTKFHNLAKLEWSADWRFLSYFLVNADNLEVLILHEVHYLKLCKEKKGWMEPHQVPTCLSSHLKIVTIHRFRCIEPEFELMKYILRNAKVLKRLEIYFDRGVYLKEYTDALKEISLFERGSEACEFVFH